MIKEVIYNEARLISTAQYENMRIEVGVTVLVEDLDSDAARRALNEAAEFVRGSLVDRIASYEDAKRGSDRAMTVDAVRRRYGL